MKANRPTDPAPVPATAAAKAARENDDTPPPVQALPRDPDAFERERFERLMADAGAIGGQGAQAQALAAGPASAGVAPLPQAAPRPMAGPAGTPLSTPEAARAARDAAGTPGVVDTGATSVGDPSEAHRAHGLPAPAAQHARHARADKDDGAPPRTEPWPELPVAVPVWTLPAAAAAPVAAPAVQATRDAELRERLADTVVQMLVGEARGGGQQVRMVVNDALVPGLTVTVQQAAAQLQVVFECSVQASRERLDRGAAGMARTLARRLGRDVAVQVQDDEGATSSALEVRAQAFGA